MNSFIEQHKRFLDFYQAAIRLAGWFLLILGIGSTGISVFVVRNLGAAAAGAAFANMPLKSSEFILFGLLGLGISQLIRLLIDRDQAPGLILRNGGRFLYAYVALIFAFMVARNVIVLGYISKSDQITPALYWATTIGSVALFAAKALILIGAAQFLKRITPVIEEHKSLV